jgi:ABC-2 type transport system permease protein
MDIILSLWQRNMKAFIRDKTSLIIAIVMPLFFVFVFSSIFETDSIENPVAYMLSGVIIMTVFEAAFKIGTSTVDDMVSGFMKEVLVSPASRVSISVAQIISAATVSTLQGILLLTVGLFLGIQISSFVSFVYIILAMVIVGVTFGSMALFLATVIKSNQAFQSVKVAITMPLVFLSGAYIPISLMPVSLQYIAFLNPLTYATAFFRTVVLEKTHLTTYQLLEQELAIDINGFIITPLIGVIILIITGVIFTFLSITAFSKTDFSKVNRVKGSGMIP